jgi:hypothetical protein
MHSHSLLLQFQHSGFVDNKSEDNRLVPIFRRLSFPEDASDEICKSIDEICLAVKLLETEEMRENVNISFEKLDMNIRRRQKFSRGKDEEI